MEEQLAVPILLRPAVGARNHEKDRGDEEEEEEEEEAELRLPIFHSDPPTVDCHSWWENDNEEDHSSKDDDLFDDCWEYNNDVDYEMRMVIRRGGIDSDLEMTSAYPGAGNRDQLDRLSVQHKTQAILNCLKGKEVDLWHLRELALSRGGLLNAELRKRAWHKLVGIDSHQVRKQQQASSNSQRLGLAAGTNAHAVPEDEIDIVRRDVHRAIYFKHLAQCESSRASSPADSSVASSSSSCGSSMAAVTPLPWDSQNSEAYHRELLSLIITAAIAPQVAVPSPTGRSEKASAAATPSAATAASERLHYYQGFHDVASIVLLNLADKPQVATAVLRKIGEGYLRDAMQSDFARVTSFLGMAFYPLLGHCDEEVHDFLWDADVGPEVVLPWVITWFAHDILDFQVASRFFDAFLSSHPLLPFYVSIAVLLRPCHRRILLEETECEAAMTQMAIYDFTRRIASDAAAPLHKEASPEQDSQVVTAQDLIDDALELMRKVPPRSLLALAKRYNQDQTLLKNAPTISFLRGPPTWNLTFKVPSDQMQRQQGRSIRRKMLSTIASSTSSAVTSSTKSSSSNSYSEMSAASPDFFRSYHRARMASGIASLMFSGGSGGRSPMSEMVSSATNVVGFLSRVLFGIDLVTKRKRLDSPIDVD